MAYNIVRFFFKNGGTQRVVRRGVTLKEAQRHCANPAASSRTATSKVAKARTRRMGPWFDVYEECQR